MDGVVGADQEISADFREFVCGGEHQLAHSRPVAAVDAFHVLGERVCVHRDFGMIVRAEELRAFNADSPITKSGAFGGAGNDTDMVGHHFVLMVDQRFSRSWDDVSSTRVEIVHTWPDGSRIRPVRSPQNWFFTATPSGIGFTRVAIVSSKQ